MNQWFSFIRTSRLPYYFSDEKSTGFGRYSVRSRVQNKNFALEYRTTICVWVNWMGDASYRSSMLSFEGLGDRRCIRFSCLPRFVDFAGEIFNRFFRKRLRWSRVYWKSWRIYWVRPKEQQRDSSQGSASNLKTNWSLWVSHSESTPNEATKFFEGLVNDNQQDCNLPYRIGGAKCPSNANKISECEVSDSLRGRVTLKDFSTTFSRIKLHQG